MSWSFNMVDKPRNILTVANESFPKMQVAQPERDMKDKALEILSISLNAWPTEILAYVNAYGSQRDVDGDTIATLKLEITSEG